MEQFQRTTTSMRKDTERQQTASNDDVKDSKSTVKKTPTPTTTNTTALERCRQARQLWLQATSQEEMDQVEALYKSALNATTQSKNKKTHSHKKLKIAELTPAKYRQAGERLSLLYCQSGRTLTAKKGLEYLGFTCRLAKQVLDYPTDTTDATDTTCARKKTKQGNKQQQEQNAPCLILDDFLHDFELKHLQSIFQDPMANYWTEHDYRVEPPSPYFSYVLDLQLTKQQGHSSSFISRLARQIQQHPILQSKFPQLAKAHMVEMWAHNRPHATGHQLHFDSDDEGRGGIVKNPVCSTILYLSENYQDQENNLAKKTAAAAAVGGPSLVTHQTLKSTSLASQGWLAHPNPRRLVIFDGKVLHGVIPGKGFLTSSSSTSTQKGHERQPRRVTLMLAFWKDIAIRHDDQNNNTPGSARPFPTTHAATVTYNNKTHKKQTLPPQWAQDLLLDTKRYQKQQKQYPQRPSTMKVVPPIPLDHVYETLDGDPWKCSTMGMPDYEQVFQGF